MRTIELQTDQQPGAAAAADDGTAPLAEREPAEPSTLVSALSGLGGLVLGSTILYFALPYCINC